MLIKMARGVTLDRKGGGTETYAGGRRFNVSDEVGKLLCSKHGASDISPPQPVDEVLDLNPPPPELYADDADDITEE